MILATQTEFAKLLGVNKSHVTRLKHAGRLVLTEDGKVDVQASQSKIAETADPAHEGKQTEAQAPSKPRDTSYNDARTRNELAKAQTAELELAVKTGKLVDADEARLFATDLAATFRGALETLWDRLAPEVVPITDIETARAVMVEHGEHMLNDLADKITKWKGTQA